MSFAACQSERPGAAPSVVHLERFHALDALRATALLLGILLHAGLAYLPGPTIGWAVQDRNTHWLFGPMILTVHSFRLEIFFLLAGFFGHLMHERRGTGRFVINRAARILVPLILGWLLVYPLLAFAWIWGAMQGKPALLGAALKAGYGEAHHQMARLAQVSAFPWDFPLTHLWFLYVLLQIYVVFLVVRAACLRGLDRSGAWRERIERGLRWAVNSSWLAPLLVILTWTVLLGMKRWGVDTPDKSFRPHLPVLLLYGGIFVLGWLLYRQTSLLEVFSRRWLPHLIIALILVLPVSALSGFERQNAHGEYAGIRLVYLVLYAAMMWSWVFTALGVFLHFCARESGWWRYLSDASYWIYIIHLPIVCTLQVAMSRYNGPAIAKCGIALVGTALVCVVTYHALVRSTPIGWLLNGRRHLFRWRNWGAAAMLNTAEEGRS